MDFATATAEYLNLRQRLAKRDLDRVGFEQAVAQLIVATSDGGRWRLAVDGAGWLTWDGAAWVPARLPADASASPAAGAVPELAGFRAPVRPASLLELLRMLLARAVAGSTRRYLIGLVIFVAAVWWLNAYLLTKLDPDGFAGLLMTVFEGHASLATKAVMWTVIGGAGTSLALRIRRHGWPEFQWALARSPQLVQAARVHAGSAGVAWLLGGAAAALAGCAIVGGRLTALALAAWVFATLSLGSGSVLFLAVWLACQDLRLGGRGGGGPAAGAPVDPHLAFLGMAGLAAGSAAAFILPWQPWSGLIGAGVLLGLAMVVCLSGAVRLKLPGTARGKGGVAK